MRILSFTRKKLLDADDRATLRDWTQQEMADFYRAHRLLVENGVGIGLDRGLTDAGDPWMAFYDSVTQDVFMHVARIGGNCVLICEPLRLQISAASVDELISSFERQVHHIVSVRKTNNSNIIVHPAARIIMSISAVFLLFKLENGGTAHAKGHEGENQASGQDLSARQEGIAAARAQTVLARMLDAVESPAAIAALAGVLLSIEIANHTTRSQASNEASSHEASLATAHDGGEVLLVDLDAATEQVALLKVDHEENIVVAQDAYVPVEMPVPVKLTLGSWAPVSVEQEVPSSTTAKPAAPAHERSESGKMVAETEAPQPIPTVEVKPESKVAAAVDKKSTLAAQAVDSVLEKLEEPVSGVSDTSPVPLKADSGVGEISFSNLDQLASFVGLVQETELAGADLSKALLYFMTAFSGYAVEVGNAGVLIEQEHISGLGQNEVGIWTNVMADGSEISVVGHVELIDDIVTMFG